MNIKPSRYRQPGSARSGPILGPKIDVLKKGHVYTLAFGQAAQFPSPMVVCARFYIPNNIEAQYVG